MGLWLIAWPVPSRRAQRNDAPPLGAVPLWDSHCDVWAASTLDKADAVPHPFLRGMQARNRQGCLKWNRFPL